MEQLATSKSLNIMFFLFVLFFQINIFSTDKLPTQQLAPGHNISSYRSTPLSEICHSEDSSQQQLHWRNQQIGAFHSKRYEWRRKGEEAWRCVPINDTDKELGVMAIIVEGTICDDAFRPLHRPHLFNFESRLWELHCYPTITGQSITEAQFRYGLILLTNEQSGYVAFPVIPSTTVRHIDLRHRRPRIPHSNPYLHHYAAISASQLTCSIDMKFVKLPIFTGQAVVFRSFEADSRDCGSTNPNGYDAVAVIPYPVRQNLRENLRSMFREMRTGSLTPFADSLRFFTASLRFHGVRAVVIEAAFLVDEVATSQLNRGREASNLTVGFQKLVYPLLASFFMQGIVVCVATFDPNMTAVATRPRLAKIGDLSLYVSPGNPKPSALYYALLDALSGPFSDHVVNQKKGQWVASLSGKTTVYQPQSLVSLIVDGVAEVTGEKKRSFPLSQLTTFWREIISICRNIPQEEVKRSLQESEIVVLTKTASDVIYCSDCVVLQGTGKSIHLEDLTTIK